MQPVNVVASTVVMVKHVIRLDWVTTTLNVYSSTSVCFTWFRGRRPPGLTREQFQARWCNEGLLAVVTAQGVLQVTLSVNHPIPLQQWLQGDELVAFVLDNVEG